MIDVLQFFHTFAGMPQTFIALTDLGAAAAQQEQYLQYQYHMQRQQQMMLLQQQHMVPYSAYRPTASPLSHGGGSLLEGTPMYHVQARGVAGAAAIAAAQINAMSPLSMTSSRGGHFDGCIL